MPDLNKPVFRRRAVPLEPLAAPQRTLKWEATIVGDKIVPRHIARTSKVGPLLMRARSAEVALQPVEASASALVPRIAATVEAPPELLVEVRDLLVRVLAAPTPDQRLADSTEPKPKRKYIRKQPTPVVTPVELKDRNWLTFKEAAALYPPSEQAFRRLARQSEQYLKDPKAGLPSNGFEHCIVRVPNSRRVYLDAVQLDLWMASCKLVKKPPHI